MQGGLDMSKEIVSKLMRNHTKLEFLSEDVDTLYEADKDEDNDSGYPGIDSKDITEEDGESIEEPVDSEEEIDNEEEDDFPTQKPLNTSTPVRKNISNEDPENEEEPEETSKESDHDNKKEYINPLDNPYAVKHGLGDHVVLSYINGKSKNALEGTVEGYDPEGFYKVKWSDGSTTNGITDIAIADMIKKTNEDKCICGCKDLVTEGKYIICDDCGRVIRESASLLQDLDKSRPKGKRMIRSEMHPISTAVKPSIAESIKKALKKDHAINESEDTEDEILEDFLSNIDSLEGEFWTRIPELISAIEELGYEVEESNNDYIIVVDGEDHEFRLPIAGTSRTFYIDYEKIVLIR